MRIKKYSNLVLFLVIAFLLPFVCVIAQTIISNEFICFILYGIQAAAPTISAIAVVYMNGEGNTFWANMFHKKHLWRAVTLPVMIAGVTMFLAKTIFCFWVGREFTLGSLPAVQFIMIAWALLAEEIGWRGYLDLWLRRSGVCKGLIPFIVGGIWCLWHYHYFLQRGIQVPVWLFCISCMIESYIYSFLMEDTDNNIVSAMVYHFAWNLSLHVFAINPSDNNGDISPYVITALIEAIVLIVYWWIRRGRSAATVQIER